VPHGKKQSREHWKLSEAEEKPSVPGSMREKAGASYPEGEEDIAIEAAMSGPPFEQEEQARRLNV